MPASRDRAELRRELLERRGALAQREARDSALAAALRRALQRLRPASVGAYCATRGEFDALPLLAELAAAGSPRLALPVVDPPTRGMRFAAWRPGEALRSGPYGIAEPQCADTTLVPELLLVPCVGFVDIGLRLGYGGGYYDRYLAGRGDVFTIGLAFDDCRLDELHAEPHDHLLDLILTETAAYGLQAAIMADDDA
jgi:5,10-methenyltetrahydrofolate synthetase